MGDKSPKNKEKKKLKKGADKKKIAPVSVLSSDNKSK
jgi:hypothetical protein